MRVDEFPVLIGELAIFNVNNPKNRRGDAPANIDPKVLPNILEPFNLRGVCRYRSLRRYIFSAAEKKWVCKNLVDFCDDVDNELLNTICLFSHRYDVPVTSVTQWIDTYANGHEFL